MMNLVPALSQARDWRTRMEYLEGGKWIGTIKGFGEAPRVNSLCIYPHHKMCTGA